MDAEIGLNVSVEVDLRAFPYLDMVCWRNGAFMLHPLTDAGDVLSDINIETIPITARG